MGTVIAILVILVSFGIGFWISDDGNPFLIGLFGVLMFGVGLAAGAVLSTWS